MTDRIQCPAYSIPPNSEPLAHRGPAAVVGETFLLIHGLELVAPDDELYAAILGVANGTMDEGAFAQWLRQRAVQA